MVQNVNNHNIPTDINPVGGSQPNSPRVTENKTAQFETSVQKLQENFLNDAKLLKASRTVRSFGDIFTANNVKRKGFFSGIKQIFANIKLYRQDPEKLLHNMEKYADELSEKIATECRYGKEFSKSSTDAVLKFVKQAQMHIYEFKQRGQPNVPPEYDVRSLKEREEDADIAEYGQKLEQFIQPNRLLKGLQKEISTFTQSVIDRCKTSNDFSSKDIQKLSSEIQSFEKNIQNLKETFVKGLPITTKQVPILPKAIQGFFAGLLREDIFLLKDFAETLKQTCEFSEKLNEQNFVENFQKIAKLKSAFKDEGKFGGFVMKHEDDIANETAYALKEAAFKSIDSNIRKFIGIDDLIEKTKAEVKQYDQYKNCSDKELEGTFEFRQKCCDFDKSDHIKALKTFADAKLQNEQPQDIQKTCKESLGKLRQFTLVPKF